MSNKTCAKCGEEIKVIKKFFMTITKEDEKIRYCPNKS